MRGAFPTALFWSRRDERRAVRSSALLSFRRITFLALILLVVVVVAAGYAIRSLGTEVTPEHQLVVWSTCGMLVFLAIALLLLGRHLMQRSLGHIEEQLRMLGREDRLEPLNAPVPEDLRRVMTALGEYVERVRSRVDRLRLQKKELDLQMRIADAERRHTEAIIFSISDAVLVIDPFAELVLANTAAEKLFAFRLRESRHRPIERILQDSYLVSLLKEARNPGASGRRQVEYSTTRDGKVEMYKITLSTVEDAEKQPRGVVAIFHDITREREIAQIKTDFVSAVSHELRTPLSGIKAYVEMLLDDEARDDGTRREFYNIIDSETDRLQRLISKILDISRIESGVMDIHRQGIQPNNIISEVIEGLYPQAREKKISLESELGENLPSIHADKDLFYQAVQNVISNSIKYTRSGGQVNVRTEFDEQEQHLVVTVSDNGMGIRSQDLPRIFDKFYRAKESMAVAKGTGLGLNLVKHIVESVHGGEISVASEYGAGTLFALRFPIGNH